MSIHERSGWRDQRISTFLRTMKDAPAVDLDFTICSYDHHERCGLMELKHERARDNYCETSGSGLTVLTKLADRASLPFLLVFYSDDLAVFHVCPQNGHARNVIPEYTRMSARAFVAMVYRLSGREATEDLLSSYTDTLPAVVSRLSDTDTDEWFQKMFKN